MQRKHSNAILPFVLLGFAVGIPVRSFPQTANNEEMTSIFTADQKDREDSMKFTPRQWEQVNARDAARREQVRKLLDSNSLKTGEDFEHAGFVFQHGNRPEDYLMAHILVVAAIARGDAKARWISAATLDRYLQSIKQAQVFGTQYSWKETPQGRRGTQEPYNQNLASDALRHEFCVSGRAEQLDNVKAISDNKVPAHPGGCR